MKPEGQVRHKLVQVRFRHLKREIRGGLSRRPQNCANNGTVNTPSGPLGVCLLGAGSPASWEGSPCDERHGGDSRAAKCPFFAPARTKDSLREGFDGFLEGASLPEIAERYPDMAALMWVLDEDTPPPAPPPEDDPEGEDPAPPVEPPKEETTPPPEEDPPADLESDERVSLTPFRPPTWKLVVASALIYLQGRITAMLEAMRRG